MAQLLSNEDEVLEAYDPSIAASRRFRYVLVFYNTPKIEHTMINIAESVRVFTQIKLKVTRSSRKAY